MVRRTVGLVPEKLADDHRVAVRPVTVTRPGFQMRIPARVVGAVRAKTVPSS